MSCQQERHRDYVNENRIPVINKLFKLMHNNEKLQKYNKNITEIYYGMGFKKLCDTQSCNEYMKTNDYLQFCIEKIIDKVHNNFQKENYYCLIELNEFLDKTDKTN